MTCVREMAVIELSCLVSLRGLVALEPIVQPTERLSNSHTIVHWESISEATEGGVCGINRMCTLY